MKNLLLFSFVVFAASISFAQSFTDNGINYEIMGATVRVSVNSGISGNIVIPNTVTNLGTTYSVTSIGNDAFYFCTALNSITIPNSVTSIGNDAFLACIALTSVTIGNSVTSIGNSTFGNCSSLTSIVIPNSVTNIGSSAFAACSALTSIVIPNSVTNIGSSAFANCSSLNVISMSTSISSIENNIFQNCLVLTEIVIPSGVTSIGDYVFSGCSALSSVTVPSTLTIIGNNAFTSCTLLSSFILPNSLISIGNYTFSECPLIYFTTLPNSLVNIGDYAFHYCAALTAITIPNSVTNIGEGAFSNCFNLMSITIPNSISSIGVFVFANCLSLTSIIIPNSVTNIGSAAFINCPSLYSITLSNSVTSIGSQAFSDCSALTNIVIPNSVINIEDWAFSDCTSLNSLIIGNSVSNIGMFAFFHCNALTSLTIPNSVTSIGYATFSECTALDSLLIGNSVTSFGYQAFFNCSSLASVTIDIITPIIIDTTIFGNINLSNVSLCVPMGSLSSYQGTDIWMNFNPINGHTVPTFDPIPSYCSGTVIPALPTTSTNGVIGTWSPAINNMVTTVYTFTPTIGCGIATLTITIQAPLATTLTNTGLATTSSCAGTLQAAMIGGTAPYSYAFNYSPSQLSSTLTNTCAGFNFVTITDAVGCIAVADYYLPFDAVVLPLMGDVLVTATSETGLCNGAAEVLVTSGTSPYTVAHSTGATTALASALCEGVYSVTITDAVGATVTLPYLVASDTNTLFLYQDGASNAYNTPPIGAIENCNVSYFDIDSVTVASVTSFAIDSVTVVWNVYSAGLLEVIPVNYYIGFGLGYYNFILDLYCPTKSNGKFLKVTAKVNVSSLVNLHEDTSFITAVYPNPFTGNFTISLAKVERYTISLLDLSGRTLFTKVYDNTNLIELSQLDYLATGEYLLEVKSADGVIVRKVTK